VEGEISTPREMWAGVPQDSVLSTILYNTYMHDALRAPGVYPALFAHDTFLYATGRKEYFVVRKFQRGLSLVKTWCER
jgi:hypothetical protein